MRFIATTTTAAAAAAAVVVVFAAYLTAPATAQFVAQSQDTAIHAPVVANWGSDSSPQVITTVVVTLLMPAEAKRYPIQGTPLTGTAVSHFSAVAPPSSWGKTDEVYWALSGNDCSVSLSCSKNGHREAFSTSCCCPWLQPPVRCRSDQDFPDIGLTAQDRYLIRFMAEHEVGHARFLSRMFDRQPRGSAPTTTSPPMCAASGRCCCSPSRTRRDSKWWGRITAT